MSVSRPHWTSRLGFILAAAGSAIGLGNIWKFPYITGKNGGGAFVLVYLTCVFLVGLPIMLAEFLIGRHSQRDAVGSFAVLSGKNSPWCLVGWGAVAASFILLSFYSVVVGWSVAYLWHSLTGGFAGQSAEAINLLFGQLVSTPGRVIFWQGLFMACTLGIVLGGVRGGIERWSKLLMPLLFFLLLLLCLRGLFSPGAREALEFMFRPDFQKLTPAALLDALGHAFFTLSIGAGVMITYGSYLERDADLFGLSLRIALLDTLVALLAGLAIFPVVFAAGLEPGAGPGLVFQTLPIVFSSLPFGSALSAVFFVLLAFAALTSSISMLETVVAYLLDEKDWSRLRATLLVGGSAFLLGLPSALSFSLWADVKPFFGRNFFDFCDLLVSSYMLPLGGLLVALFAAWAWRADAEKAELAGAAPRPWLFPLWHWLLRYLAPAAVLIILLNQMGIITG